MELNQSDHQCLDHLSNQDPFTSIAQFGQEARSRKSPDCFKVHPLRIMEAKCSCEPSNFKCQAKGMKTCAMSFFSVSFLINLQSCDKSGFCFVIMVSGV